MRTTEKPITNFADEVTLAIDRLREAAKLEKEATWAAARNHIAEVDKRVTDAIAALRPMVGLPSIHALQHDDEVKTEVALTVLGRLGRLARGVSPKPEKEAA